MKRSLLLLLLFACFACNSNQEIQTLLDQAESEMEADPEQVRALLSDMDPASFSKESFRARHALLYSQALDKCYIDLNSDTLIRRAITYFDRYGEDDERALSYYYLGVVEMNAEAINEAVAAFTYARIYAQKASDRFLLALIASCFGNLYSVQHNFESALAQYREAERLFQVLGQPRNQLMMLESIGNALWELRQDQAAISTWETAAQLAIELQEKNPQKVLDIYLKLGIAKFDTEKEPDDRFLQEAKRRLTDYFTHHTGGDVPEEYYPFVGQILLYSNELDSARYYYSEYLSRMPENPSSEIGYYQHLAELERRQGNYEQAIQLERTYSHLLDSLHHNKKNQMVAQLEQRYLARYAEESAAMLREKHRYTAIIYILLILIITLILITILIRLHRVSRQRKENLLRYHDYVAEAELHYDELMAKYTDLAHDLQIKEKNMEGLYAMLGNRIEAIRQMVELAHLYSNEPNHFYNSFRERIKLSSAKSKIFAQDVISMADLSFGGIIVWLQQQYPTLTQYELCYCSLVLLGFSKESIRILYNHTNLHSIYNIQNSIRAKIGLVNNSAQTLETYLNALKQQHTSHKNQ